MQSDATEIESMRAAFFRRTRATTVVLYGALAAAAVGAAIYAVSTDLMRAVAGIAVGLVAVLALFGASPMVRVSARAARGLVLGVGVAGVIVANVAGGVETRVGASGLWGGFAGLMLGAIIGVARIRRRLAWDDELLLRQKQLGFDPERPYDWLHRGRRSRDDA
jgi:hypothetical protein